MRARFLFLVVALCAVAIACTKNSTVRDVAADEFHAALAKPDALVLDVRELTEAGVNTPLVAGSLQIPLSMLPANLVTVPKDRARRAILKHGRRLKGPELVATAEFNTRLGRSKRKSIFGSVTRAKSWPST